MTVVHTSVARAAAPEAEDIRPTPESRPSRGVLSTGGRVFNLLGSYGLSCTLLFFLFVVTLLGTLSQVNTGLYAAQERYFESLVLVQKFGFLPLPLPGGRLLLALLFVNLLCGAILRARKGWSRIGILTTHVGILLLLAGAFITYGYSQSGQMVLYEGQESGVFESDREWELAIAPLSTKEAAGEFVIPASLFEDAVGGRSKTFSTDALPFEVEVSDYTLNATPQPAGPNMPKGAKVVDGYYLRAGDGSALQNERAAPGARIAVRDAASDARQQGLVWGLETAPWTVRAGGGEWRLSLRKQRWSLPFTLVLNKFSRELHPRTTAAKAYASEVTKVKDGLQQPVRISMNEPLRSDGYTVYQASWGPQDAAPGTRLYSVLAVTRNPAERFPLYACVVVTFGMTLHFAIRLMKHLRRDEERPA